jgi:hypothetical protein
MVEQCYGKDTLAAFWLHVHCSTSGKEDEHLNCKVRKYIPIVLGRVVRTEKDASCQ